MRAVIASEWGSTAAQCCRVKCKALPHLPYRTEPRGSASCSAGSTDIIGNLQESILLSPQTPNYIE